MNTFFNSSAIDPEDDPEDDSSLSSSSSESTLEPLTELELKLGSAELLAALSMDCDDRDDEYGS